MNHPFPKNIPLIRRLYAGRFEKILFLVPFHRSEEADVITVYRGSYVHAGYITDAREKLLAIDCDHFLFIHDDVILNPAIDDASFYDYFPLGAHDGFFPSIGSPPSHIGSWSWFYGFVARIMFPKSLLFGSGVEIATLERYLPPADLIANRIKATGVALAAGAWVNTDGFEPIREIPSRVLFNGLAGDLSAEPEQLVTIEEKSRHVAERLVEVMADIAGASHGRGPNSEGEWVDFPRPFVTGGFFADCYIVPKSRLADYAHFVGVASAAHVLTELMAPTTLYAVCDRVLSAKDCGLDLEGFSRNVELELLFDKRVMAIHPFKMSLLRSSDEAANFLNQIDWIRTGRPDFLVAAPGVHSFALGGSGLPFVGRGWSYPEEWGRWSSITNPTLRFVVLNPLDASPVRVRLHFPLHEAIPRFVVRISMNGSEPVVVVKGSREHPLHDVLLRAEAVRVGTVNTIDILTDILRPCELEPGNTDGRPLGVGVIEIEFANVGCAVEQGKSLTCQDG